MSRATDYSPANPLVTAKPDAPPLVLASQSAARRDLLLNAGLPVRVQPAGVDESEIKESMRGADAAPDEVAESLAQLKAHRVSAHHPGCLVLGADQLLTLDGAWMDKPATREQAAEQLRRLSGREHTLVVTAVLVKEGARIWHQTDTATLRMRRLSDTFIQAYLDAVGDAALASVGGYQLEGAGAQLFARVRGDYFTVLGLPLLPLLNQLRNLEVIPQ